MRLPQKEVEYVANVVSHAKMIGIDNVIIESGSIRGIDTNKTMLILHNKNVPDFSFGSACFNRLSVLKSRLELAQDTIQMDADVEQEGQPGSFVRTLKIKSGALKVDYRCANPATVRIPKSINDPIAYTLRMTPDATAMLLKGGAAMETTEVLICNRSGSIHLEISDINGDILTFDIKGTAHTTNGDEPPDFTYKYPIKLLHTFFKTSPNASFTLTKQGFLYVEISGITTILIPLK